LPDLNISESNLYVLHGDQNISGCVFGTYVKICADIQNLGFANATGFVVRLGIRSTEISYNYSFFEWTCNLSHEAPNNMLHLNYTWTVAITMWGDYELWIFLDPGWTTGESDVVDNWADIPFSVYEPGTELVVTTDKVDYHLGDGVLIDAVIYYANSTTGIPFVPAVRFVLVDISTGREVPDTWTQAVTSSVDGKVVAYMIVPLDLVAGQYTIMGEFFGETHESYHVVDVSERGSSWSLTTVLAIVGLIAAVLVASSLYLILRRKPKV